MIQPGPPIDAGPRIQADSIVLIEAEVLQYTLNGNIPVPQNLLISFLYAQGILTVECLT